MNPYAQLNLQCQKADRERRELRRGDGFTLTDEPPKPLPAGARMYRVECHDVACPNFHEPPRQWAVNAADTVPAWCRWCNGKATAEVEVIP